VGIQIINTMRQELPEMFDDELEERIIAAENARINLSELYTSFKEWFKESVPGQQLPTKSEVKEYYTKMWGEPERGNVWRGRRSMTYEDQVEKGDILVVGLDE
jgi:ribonucleotide reductase beta subunit family protein with ferritin-like domain